jgi:hypothetical protein
MREAIRTMFRTLPLDPAEPQSWSDRRMHASLLALSALHPRDEIEVMLGVQAMSAYHDAAAACWRIGMNLGPLSGNNIRHISTACSAARTFDTMLRALERRQAKPLSVPIGRPAPRTWDDAPDDPRVSRRGDPTQRSPRRFDPDASSQLNRQDTKKQTADAPPRASIEPRKPWRLGGSPS